MDVCFASGLVMERTHALSLNPSRTHCHSSLIVLNTTPQKQYISFCHCARVPAWNAVLNNVKYFFYAWERKVQGNVRKCSEVKFVMFRLRLCVYMSVYIDSRHQTRLQFTFSISAQL